MKDPTLKTYTFEELLYEYHSSIAFEQAVVDDIKKERDKIELDKEIAAEDWADMMEKEEEEAREKAKNKIPVDPMQDPENIRWMEEQLKLEKEMYGEDYGENFNLDFSSED